MISHLPAFKDQIHPSAQLGENVQIGANVTIEEGVVIGNGCILEANSFVGRDAILGEGCHLYPGAVVGTPPQDLGYKNEFSRAVLGNNVQVREYVTIHRATGEGAETLVGDDCMLMAYSHVAHNCKVGNSVILANAAQLAGYVEVGDYTNIGGVVAIHQFVKIGRFVMMTGFSSTRQDIPPFIKADGLRVSMRGINSIGLKRRGVGPESRKNIKEAYKLLWFSKLPKVEALHAIQDAFPDDEYVQEIIQFIKSSKRGIRKPQSSGALEE